MKMTKTIPVAITLLYLSLGFSVSAQTVQPAEKLTYWKQGNGFVEKKINDIEVKVSFLSFQENTLTFQIYIANKSDSPIIVDSTDFILREISQIPLNAEKIASIGEPETARSLNDVAKPLLAGLTGLNVVSVVSVINDGPELTFPAMLAKDKLDRLYEKYLQKSTIDVNEKYSGVINVFYPRYRALLSAEEKRTEKLKKNTHMSTTDTDINIIYPDKPVVYYELTYGTGSSALSFYFTCVADKKK